MDTTLKKLTFLNEVICYYIQVVKQYSTFLGDALLDNWSKYRDSKKKKYYNNLKNNLSKLTEIEKRKKIAVDRYEYDETISLSFYNNLYKELSDSITNSLIYMISYFDRIRNKEDNKPKEEKDPLRIKYIKLDDGYYAHLRYEKKKLVINKTSFKNETIIFKSSLSGEQMKWEEIKNLSSYEKRRRKIIDKSFGVCKKICLINNNEIFLNVDYVYEICKNIVDDLYDDIVSKDRECDIFTKLMDLTKKQYGSFNYLTDYDVLYMNYSKAKNEFDSSMLENISNRANVLKKTSMYIEFKDIDEIIPSIFDIYNVLNNRIINSIVLSVRDLKEKLAVVSSYMTIDEMVRYYKRLIEIKKDVKYSIKCQKSFVELIEERFNIPEKIILCDYMQEDKIFK